jgi:hypothetical protein
MRIPLNRVPETLGLIKKRPQKFGAFGLVSKTKVFETEVLIIVPF